MIKNNMDHKKLPHGINTSLCGSFFHFLNFLLKIIFLIVEMEYTAQEIVQAMLIHISLMTAATFMVFIAAHCLIVNVWHSVSLQRICIILWILPNNSVILSRCDEHKRIIHVFLLQRKRLWSEKPILMHVICRVLQYSRSRTKRTDITEHILEHKSNMRLTRPPIENPQTAVFSRPVIVE